MAVPVANDLLEEDESVIVYVLPVLLNVRFVVVANDQIVPVPESVIAQLLKSTVLVLEFDE